MSDGYKGNCKKPEKANKQRENFPSILIQLLQLSKTQSSLVLRLTNCRPLQKMIFFLASFPSQRISFQSLNMLTIDNHHWALKRRVVVPT